MAATSWSLVALEFAVGPFLFDYLSKHIGIKNDLLLSLDFFGKWNTFVEYWIITMEDIHILFFLQD